MKNPEIKIDSQENSMQKIPSNDPGEYALLGFYHFSRKTGRTSQKKSEHFWFFDNND